MSSRRNFLKTSGLGAGFLGLCPSNLTGSLSSESVSEQQSVQRISLKVSKPLFCPYYSIDDPEDRGGGRHYFRSEVFQHNPFTIRANGTSGSPIIIDSKGKFIGFLSSVGYDQSVFSFDGKETLTIHYPAGQELFIDESENGDEAWMKYNTEMMRRLAIQPLANYPSFWHDIEYCTWVEQKFYSKERQGHFNLLNHDFVMQYLNKIIELGYPKGKLTLDHGWALFPDGTLESGYGSWVPDPKKFPDFKRTMHLIKEKGFTPGMWIGFPKIQANSLIAKQQPEMLGQWETANQTPKPGDVRYLNPKADIFEYASEVINRFYEMGVMKFKIDMSYNTKSDMLHIHKELYNAAKSIDKNIEMEFHVPDIFFAKYTDVIRTNDVWLTDKYNWPSRVKTHYETCYKSAPGRLINLDHIGGNDHASLTEEKYLRHLEMFKGKTGYPLVSMLPNHISKKCVEETGRYLWDYTKGNKKVVSDFFIQKNNSASQLL